MQMDCIQLLKDIKRQLDWDRKGLASYKKLMSSVVVVRYRLLAIKPHQYHVSLPSAGTRNAINIYYMTCFKRYMS